MKHTGRGSGLAVIAAVVAMVTGCGVTAESPAERTAASISIDRPAEVRIAVRIAGATVTPTNTRTEARLFQPIVIALDSDAADELHVHSEPSQTFPVEARAGQEFRFIVTVPGRVDIELHRAGKTITTLLIRQ
ncbi:hypothetical protein V7968_40690 [Nocardia vulneris]|uniref:EfeO-type cupredoxin-like domain-containing protein n=1 Tax=Nocardia brasiliensis (strain ATCC 700358 / HUJEG-1) TaxID=1133849 RepID=K0EXB5_NOCB7|nr:hypothetical protein [Nocardia brasiliensis]AFU04523.1 hypothetical protein O3I_032870 [Nocardia brasiliensis ATCC 700358]OCF85752.1 hypothetical protein AW168_35020 [Nocardia brasiliensis]